MFHPFIQRTKHEPISFPYKYECIYIYEEYKTRLRTFFI